MPEGTAILDTVRDLQLGDIIDDYCVKCRRLTNHAIVSLLDGQAAKVRCRTCYSDHDYRHEIAPPTKRELMKQKELFNAVLAGMANPAEAAAVPMVDPLFADVAEIPLASDGAETPAPLAKPAPKVKKKTAPES